MPLNYHNYTIIKKRFRACVSGYIHKAKDSNVRIVAPFEIWFYRKGKKAKEVP